MNDADKLLVLGALIRLFAPYAQDDDLTEHIIEFRPGSKVSASYLEQFGFPLQWAQWFVAQVEANARTVGEVK